MSRQTRCITVALFSLVFTGCTCAREPVAEVSPPAAKAPRLEGEIHTAGQRQRVAPFVMHEPGLDLRVQCLARRDTLVKEGKTVALCFDDSERQVEATVTTLRIEHQEGMRIAEALHVLRSVDESAHFVVDDGGSPYQLLDLAHAARRDGSYRPAELRVMSGHAAGHARLTAALKGLYPKLTVENVEARRPTAAPTPAPDKPAASAGDGNRAAPTTTP